MASRCGPVRRARAVLTWRTTRSAAGRRAYRRTMPGFRFPGRRWNVRGGVRGSAGSRWRGCGPRPAATVRARRARHRSRRPGSTRAGTSLAPGPPRRRGPARSAESRRTPCGRSDRRVPPRPGGRASAGGPAGPGRLPSARPKSEAAWTPWSGIASPDYNRPKKNTAGGSQSDAGRRSLRKMVQPSTG